MTGCAKEGLNLKASVFCGQGGEYAHMWSLQLRGAREAAEEEAKEGGAALASGGGGGGKME